MSQSLVTRRSFPGALALLMAGGLVWRASDTGAFSAGRGPAYEAWTDWRTNQDDGAMSLVRAGILAANPHNTQPWLFHLGPSRIDLLADHERTLGTIDPFRREMHIGLGCALENLALASAAHGHTPIVTLTPQPEDPAYIARLDLLSGHLRASDLYNAIPRRHTNRGPYDTARPISGAPIAALTALNQDADLSVRWFGAGAERRVFGECMVEATQAFIADPEQLRDSTRWFRLRRAAVERHRDGVTLDAAGLPALVRVAAKLATALAEDPTQEQWLRMTHDTHVRTASAFGVIVARDALDVRQRLRAGRLWQRMHLWATGHGLAMHPMNQINERADREQSLGMRSQPFGDALRGFVGDSGWHALMTFRTGYPLREALPSPRRRVREVLL